MWLDIYGGLLTIFFFSKDAVAFKIVWVFNSWNVFS